MRSTNVYTAEEVMLYVIIGIQAIGLIVQAIAITMIRSARHLEPGLVKMRLFGYGSLLTVLSLLSVLGLAWATLNLGGYRAWYVVIHISFVVVSLGLAVYFGGLSHKDYQGYRQRHELRDTPA